MHNAGFAAAAGLDKITRSQNDAASPAEHNRSVWVFHGCFDDDASTFGKVVPPGSTQGPIILLKEPNKLHQTHPLKFIVLCCPKVKKSLIRT